MKLSGLRAGEIGHHILMGYRGVINGVQNSLVKSIVFRVLKKAAGKALSQQFFRLSIQDLCGRGINVCDHAVHSDGHDPLGHIPHDALPDKLCMFRHIHYTPKPKYPRCFR